MLVRTEYDDAIATITLDSPANRNALSKQLVTELIDALQATAQSAAKVVVIGSSQRVFCSGADLSEAAEGGMAQGAATLVEIQRLILAHPLPIVVRLDGPVRAGGLGIVAAADLVIAHEATTFAFTEVRLALAPAVISLTVLPRLNNRAAYDTFLTGRTFSAEEAAQMGLITRATDDVDSAVADVCADLVKGHPQGLAETKALLAAPMLAYLDANAVEMAALSALLFGSDSAREAMLAFLSGVKSHK